ncbi:gamma-glutamylcyclotransferase family protein [uncultured Piscinibacter sp.]|uniref:gamma-glutamylcyclotransferase family protein n=1 Tax=uncultured Piscinibacter sp. TaxID=1131835 RepID=UPI00260BB042|nr:gamma-glutamylcyclotransferase family protein [uncultured Piscinibacter sp.]
MAALVFVYGTLKEGHRNAHVNAGVRVPGEFVTVERYPLYVIGAHPLPWLVDRPGQGEPVLGQLYDVDAQALQRLDALERIDEPDWYSRGKILVRPRTQPQAPPVWAMVYFGSAQRLAGEVRHAGPLAEFTLQHAAAFAGLRR